MADKNTIVTGELNIDIFKLNTLNRLKNKGEEERHYPIKKSDLTRISACALCGSKKKTLISRVFLNKKLNFFTTATCNKCLYTYRPVSPSMSWFKKCWKIIESVKLEVFNPETEKLRTKRYAEYLDFLPKYISNGRVLEIGAGYGTGLNLFREHGYDVEAIEPEINKQKYIKNFFKIPVVSDTIEKFVINKKKYDMILFTQCLEHIEKPKFVMMNIKNLLAPKGILYLEVPILWNYTSWSDSLYMAHKSNFTEKNILDLIRKGGFEILKKFKIRHSENYPWDLGMILKQGKDKSKNIEEKHTVNDIKKLYRKKIPLAKRSSMDKPLLFSVPYIDQFFQTLNLSKKVMISPDKKSPFITFYNK